MPHSYPQTVLQEMQVAARALVQLPPTEPESTAHHLQVTGEQSGG